MAWGLKETMGKNSVSWPVPFTGIGSKQSDVNLVMGGFIHIHPPKMTTGRIAVSQPCSSQDACQSPGRIQGSPLLTGWFSMGETHATCIVIEDFSYFLVRWRHHIQRGGVEMTALLMQPLVTTIQTQLAVGCAEQTSSLNDHFPDPKWLSKGSQQGECWAPTSCCCMKKALWLAFSWCCFDHALKVVQWPT